MKKLNILLALILILIFAATVPASASILDGVKSLFTNNNQPVAVYVDSKKVDFPDQQPYIDSNSRTLVPVRFVSESLGAEVGWDGKKQEVTVDHQAKNKLVLLWVNKKDYTINGQKKTMDTQAILTAQARVMVPLRFVSEALGARVDWQPIDKNGVVHIFTKEQSAEEIKQIKDKTESDLTGKEPKETRYPVLDQYEKTGITKAEQLTPEVVEALKALIPDRKGWTVPDDAMYEEHKKAIEKDFAELKGWTTPLETIVISKDLVRMEQLPPGKNGYVYSPDWYYVIIIDGKRFGEASIFYNGGLKAAIIPAGDGPIFELNYKAVK